jgi:hypothetical protein
VEELNFVTLCSLCDPSDNPETCHLRLTIRPLIEALVSLDLGV